MSSGCQSVLSEGASTAGGIGGAALAGAVTRNGAAAAGIGLAVQAGTRSVVQYSERVAHNAEQDAIARAAGPLPVGGVAPWSIEHQVPVEPDEHGRVTVSRVFGAPLLDCKEIVFSVDSEAGPQTGAKGGAYNAQGQAPTSEFFVATVCRDGDAWKWALAEPATARWGSLQ